MGFAHVSHFPIVSIAKVAEMVTAVLKQNAEVQWTGVVALVEPL
jgi:hypothetical protein